MVETKLLPLVLDCPDDLELIVTVTKILVLLTLPMSPTTRRYACLHAPPASHVPGAFDSRKRRVAARAQNAHLLKMKKALTHAGLAAVLVAALEGPLSRGGREARTEEDTLLIELVLTLLRNLLSIEDVTQADGGGEGGREELLLVLEEECVLDVVRFL